jgi:hypothetical protein
MSRTSILWTVLSVVALVLPLNVVVHAAEATPAEQRAVAERFCAKAVMSKVVYDDAGNVIKLAVSNHAAFWPHKDKPVPPGIDNELFREVLKLTKLQAIFLEKQPLSDESYALLKQLKALQDVRLHYPAGVRAKPAEAAPVPATADFALCINDLPGLKVLQLKHIFSVPGDGIAKLKPQSELEHAELDTICSGPSAVPFLKAATKLRNLQVHRTSMSDAQLQEVLAALPNLEVLELRPNNQPKEGFITGRSLRGLKHCPKLRVLHISLQWKELPWDGGLDVLATLPHLQQVVLAPSDLKELSVDSPQIRKLHEARPDLLIVIGGKSIGGKPGQQKVGIDDGYDWGGSVTTHG